MLLLFEKYLFQFREVYRLAVERRIAHDSNPQTDTIEKLINLKETEEEFTANSNLEKYLDSLDFETIKIIQTIMYLGRDKDYDKKLEPKEIYLQQRRYFDNEVGWNTPIIESNLIFEKFPLDEYLKDGFEILGIRV